MQLRIKRPSVDLKALAARVRRPGFEPQAATLTLGVFIPAMLVWLAHWLVFSLSGRVTFIQDFLDKNAAQIEAVLPEFKLSSFYSEVLIKLNTNSGLAFVVVGLLVFVFAIFLSLWVFRAHKMQAAELGAIKLQSLVWAALISLTLAAVVVAVLNQVFIFAFPAELIQIFWP